MKTAKLIINIVLIVLMLGVLNENENNIIPNIVGVASFVALLVVNKDQATEQE